MMNDPKNKAKKNVGNLKPGKRVVTFVEETDVKENPNPAPTQKIQVVVEDEVKQTPNDGAGNSGYVATQSESEVLSDGNSQTAGVNGYTSTGNTSDQNFSNVQSDGETENITKLPNYDETSVAGGDGDFQSNETDAPKFEPETITNSQDQESFDSQNLSSQQTSSADLNQQVANLQDETSLQSSQDETNPQTADKKSEAEKPELGPDGKPIKPEEKNQTADKTPSVKPEDKSLAQQGQQKPKTLEDLAKPKNELKLQSGQKIPNSKQNQKFLNNKGSLSDRNANNPKAQDLAKQKRLDNATRNAGKVADKTGKVGGGLDSVKNLTGGGSAKDKAENEVKKVAGKVAGDAIGAAATAAGVPFGQAIGKVAGKLVENADLKKATSSLKIAGGALLLMILALMALVVFLVIAVRNPLSFGGSGSSNEAKVSESPVAYVQNSSGSTTGFGGVFNQTSYNGLGNIFSLYRFNHIEPIITNDDSLKNYIPQPFPYNPIYSPFYWYDDDNFDGEFDVDSSDGKMFPQYIAKYNCNGLIDCALSQHSAQNYSPLDLIFNSYFYSGFNLLNLDRNDRYFQAKNQIPYSDGKDDVKEFYDWIRNNGNYKSWFDEEKFWTPKNITKGWIDPNWSPEAGDILFSKVIQPESTSVYPDEMVESFKKDSKIPDHVEIVENVFFTDYEKLMPVLVDIGATECTKKEEECYKEPPTMKRVCEEVITKRTIPLGIVEPYCKPLTKEPGVMDLDRVVQKGTVTVCPESFPCLPKNSTLVSGTCYACVEKKLYYHAKMMVVSTVGYSTPTNVLTAITLNENYKKYWPAGYNPNNKPFNASSVLTPQTVLSGWTDIGYKQGKYVTSPIDETSPTNLGFYKELDTKRKECLALQSETNNYKNILKNSLAKDDKWSTELDNVFNAMFGNIPDPTQSEIGGFPFTRPIELTSQVQEITELRMWRDRKFYFFEWTGDDKCKPDGHWEQVDINTVGEINKYSNQVLGYGRIKPNTTPQYCFITDKPNDKHYDSDCDHNTFTPSCFNRVVWKGSKNPNICVAINPDKKPTKPSIKCCAMTPADARKCECRIQNANPMQHVGKSCGGKTITEQDAINFLFMSQMYIVEGGGSGSNGKGGFVSGFGQNDKYSWGTLLDPYSRFNDVSEKSTWATSDNAKLLVTLANAGSGGSCNFGSYSNTPVSNGVSTNLTNEQCASIFSDRQSFEKAVMEQKSQSLDPKVDQFMRNCTFSSSSRSEILSIINSKGVVGDALSDSCQKELVSARFNFDIQGGGKDNMTPILDAIVSNYTGYLSQRDYDYLRTTASGNSGCMWFENQGGMSCSATSPCNYVGAVFQYANARMIGWINGGCSGDSGSMSASQFMAIPSDIGAENMCESGSAESNGTDMSGFNSCAMASCSAGSGGGGGGGGGTVSAEAERGGYGGSGNSSNIDKLKSELVCPNDKNPIVYKPLVCGSSSNSVSFGFGDIYNSGGLKNQCHPGVDVVCQGRSNNTGVEVVTMTDGVVTYAGKGNGKNYNGNTVVVTFQNEMGEACALRYMHLKKNLKVEIGQEIKAGTTVGFIEDLYGDGGQHLHLDGCCGSSCPLLDNPSWWGGDDWKVDIKDKKCTETVQGGFFNPRLTWESCK
ncbi:MAG: hypothetical protein Fur0024_0150 [Patescibacteria group bacterium]